MKLEYPLLPKIPHRARTEVFAPPPVVSTRPPRITCLLALAHRFEHLVHSGGVRDYAEIARLGRVSRARVSQILKLLMLAPCVQEQLLALGSREPGSEPVTERDLRPVVKELCFERQRELFAKLLAAKGSQP